MEMIRTADAGTGSDALLRRLTTELMAEKSVLWFLSGGSAIPISVNVMAQIDADLTRNLTVALIDERFGPVGHKDSNWQQLDAAGFDCQQATRLDVLTSDANDLVTTAAVYDTELENLFGHQQVIIAQLGMGPDGHISGILPASPAIDAKGLVTSYATATYDRVTTTFEAIRNCQAAYLFAFGEDKRSALKKLCQDISLRDQPAQILKQLPEAYIYNDQIGETI